MCFFCPQSPMMLPFRNSRPRKSIKIGVKTGWWVTPLVPPQTRHLNRNLWWLARPDIPVRPISDASFEGHVGSMKMMRSLVLASLVSFPLMVSDVSARVIPLQSCSADPEALDPSLVSRFDFVGAGSDSPEVVASDVLAIVPSDEAEVSPAAGPSASSVENLGAVQVSESGASAVSGPPSTPIKVAAAPQVARSSVHSVPADAGAAAPNREVGTSSAEDPPKKAVLFTLPSAEECRILIFALVGGGVAGLFFRGRLLQERQASLALMD